MKPLPVIIRTAGVAAAGILLWQSAVEFYERAPEIGHLLGKFTAPWATAYLFWLSLCVILFITACVLGFAHSRVDWAKFLLLRWRNSLGSWRWLLVAMIVLAPAIFFLFTNWGSYFESPAIRATTMLVCGFGTAILAGMDDQKLAGSLELGFGFLLPASVFVAAKYLVQVTDYPFALGWSEGNRLYDYSIILGSSRYSFPGTLSSVRADVGRQLLWGIPFIIPNSPIWLHRLWNALLSFLPDIGLGIILAKWSKLPKIGYWVFTLWAFLFLNQGPIYTPLILSAILIALFVHWGKWILSASATGIAGYYASLSRFIWLPAAPVWASFILLADPRLATPIFPKSIGGSAARFIDMLRKLLPIIILAGIGLAGGMLANPLLLQPKELSQGTTMAQPLLWYRLLPNVTYPEGVLLALLMASGSLVVLLIWLAAAKLWQLNWLQGLAYSATSLVFLSGGLIASVKIGGGNNLHNLDMFLLSLAILAALAVRDIQVKSLAGWPVISRILLALAVIIPVWSAIVSGSRLSLPPADQTAKALELLRQMVLEAEKHGEVLFMDQRQLLTFGNIKGVDLTPEYEKKFVMDKAMAGEQSYFEKFYSDLAHHRFSLIVSDPLFTRIKDSSYIFAEENNAWVEYVTKPMLCYYAPMRGASRNVLEVVNVQLLIPRATPSECPLPWTTVPNGLN